MTKALVLGSTGMLGSAVVAELEAQGIEVQVASRTQGILFDATDLDVTGLLANSRLRSGDYVVNCVGLTKSRIDEDSISSRASAVRLNVDFPNALATEAERARVRVIQVATDCVFSGATGGYSESSDHDPLDVYGKTKSLGEAPSDFVMHLRCSLIGPEQGRSSLFFEWVRQQPPGAHINGFTNHLWNGLSSTAFGRIVAGIIKEDLFQAGVQHLVPKGIVTKDQLVRLVLNSLGRNDVTVESISAAEAINRTLSTSNQDFNQKLFRAAGFETLPTIAEMVDEICSNLSN
jgi:dTDP-4-dehydrorhamnose reductase